MVMLTSVHSVESPMIVFLICLKFFLDHLMGPASKSSVLFLYSNLLISPQKENTKLLKRHHLSIKSNQTKKIVHLVFLLFGPILHKLQSKSVFFQKVLMFLPFPQTYKPFIFIRLRIWILVTEICLEIENDLYLVWQLRSL